MKSLSFIPNGYKEVVRVYGNPDANGDGCLDAGWARDHLAVFNFPHPMRAAGGVHTLSSETVYRKFWEYGQQNYHPDLLKQFAGKSADDVSSVTRRDFAEEWNPIDFMQWKNAGTWRNKFQAHKLVGEAIADALAEAFEVVGVEEMRAKSWDQWAGCFNFRNNVNAKPLRLSTHAWAIACDLNPHLAPLGVAECHQPLQIVLAFKRRGFIWAAGDWMHVQSCINF